MLAILCTVHLLQRTSSPFAEDQEADCISNGSEDPGNKSGDPREPELPLLIMVGWGIGNCLCRCVCLLVCHDLCVSSSFWSIINSVTLSLNRYILLSRSLSHLHPCQIRIHSALRIDEGGQVEHVLPIALGQVYTLESRCWIDFLASQVLSQVVVAVEGVSPTQSTVHSAFLLCRPP